MDRTVHIYTDRSVISILLVVVKGAMVLLGIFILARAFFSGEVGQVLWIGLVLIAGGAFFGGYDLLKLLDRSPQVTLGPEGFVDHRIAVPVVIPWDHFRSLGYRSAGSSGWTLEIFLADGGRQMMQCAPPSSTRQRRSMRSSWNSLLQQHIYLCTKV